MLFWLLDSSLQNFFVFAFPSRKIVSFAFKFLMMSVDDVEKIEEGAQFKAYYLYL